MVQGQGQEEQRRIQETFEKYERLNEISDEDIVEEKEESKKQDDVEEETEERVVEASVEMIRRTEETEGQTEQAPVKVTQTTQSTSGTSRAKDSELTSEKVELTESPVINGKSDKFSSWFQC